ncbi:hypothetical protein vseg_012026 [Gypsophila vaccaria]
MKETHTPRQPLSQRRPKNSPSTKSSTADLPKSSQKVAKKNLSTEFSSVSEDVIANDSVAESFDFSPISEVLSDIDINHNEESLDNFECVFTGEEALNSSNSSESSKINVRDCDKILNIEVDVMANLLKQARAEIWSSNNVSPRSKKLLDSLFQVYVKECCSFPQEMKLVNVLISEKTQVAVFCFAAWLITMTVITVIVFHGSSNRGTSSFFLPPT